MSKRATRKSVVSKRPKTKLGVPDLDHSKAAVLDSLRSPESKRGYRHAIDEFISWYCSEPRLSFSKVVVTRFRIFLENRGLAASTINGRLAAVRRLAYWVKTILDEWVHAAELHSGRIFRCVCRANKCWGDGVTERVVWHVVKLYAAKSGFASLAPHDLRRSCAKLCHSAGGELEQIQFLPGHVSVQTTKRYLGCKQHIRGAVNDRIGIET